MNLPIAIVGIILWLNILVVVTSYSISSFKPLLILVVILDLLLILGLILSIHYKDKE